LAAADQRPFANFVRISKVWFSFFGGARCVVYNGRSIGGLAMIRSYIKGAVLLLGSVCSKAQTTVKEFTMNMGNPDRKDLMEYMHGNGARIFWSMVAARPKKDCAVGCHCFVHPKTHPSQGKLFWMQRNMSWRRQRECYLLRRAQHQQSKT